MEIKVSVIIPVHNAECKIRQCLDSILNQSLKEIEIISVYNDSDSDSLSVLEEYAKKDVRLQMVRQNKGSVENAQNIGMKAASGEYILFFNVDAFAEKNMLETVYSQAEKTKADICVCDVKTNKNDVMPYGLDISMLPEKEVFNFKDVPEYIFLFTSFMLWNKIYRREFIRDNEIGIQNSKNYNDIYTGYLGLVFAERISVVQQKLVNYYKEENNSYYTDGKAQFDFGETLKDLRGELIKHNKYVEVEKSFKNCSLNICIGILDIINEYELFEEMCQYLKSLLYEIGIVGHSRGYFFCKDNFLRMLRIYGTEPEVLWKEQSIRKKNSIKELDFDFSETEHKEIHLGYPKISVIVPVYNVQEYIEEALDSLIHQTLKEIEIICIDDGSTDGSSGILEKYKKSDARIKVFRKKNGGLSSARNYGIERAQGRYIYFIDSDDILQSNALEICYHDAEKNDLDMVMFTAEAFGDLEDAALKQFKDFYKRYTEYKGILSGREFFIKAVLAKEFKPSACMYIIKHKFLNNNQLRFYEGIIHEDNLFTIECLALAERVKYLNCFFYKRRVREDSIMTSSKAFHRAYSLYIVLRELGRFIEVRQLNNDPEFYNAACEQMLRIRNAAISPIIEMSQEEMREEAKKHIDGLAFYFYICDNALLKKQFSVKNVELGDVKSRKIKYEYDIDHVSEKNKKLNIQINTLKLDNAKMKRDNSRLKSIETKYNKIMESLPYKIMHVILSVSRKVKRVLSN